MCRQVFLSSALTLNEYAYVYVYVYLFIYLFLYFFHH